MTHFQKETSSGLINFSVEISILKDGTIFLDDPGVFPVGDGSIRPGTEFLAMYAAKSEVIKIFRDLGFDKIRFRVERLGKDAKGSSVKPRSWDKTYTLRNPRK